MTEALTPEAVRTLVAAATRASDTMRSMLLDAARVLDELPRLPANERKAKRDQLRDQLLTIAAEVSDSPITDGQEAPEYAARRFAGELERLHVGVLRAVERAGIDPAQLTDPIPVSGWAVTAALALIEMQAERIFRLERDDTPETHLARPVGPIVQELTDTGHSHPVDPAAALAARTTAEAVTAAHTVNVPAGGPASIADLQRRVAVDQEKQDGADLVADLTALHAALAGTFTPTELAELAHGLADVPNLIRGAGGLAVRPLAGTAGPLSRLAAAAAAASGYAAPGVTTRGVVPLVR